MTPLLLETRRLTLTQLSGADEPALVTLYEDPVVMEFIFTRDGDAERGAHLYAVARADRVAEVR
jgi:hypothetical protein